MTKADEVSISNLIQNVRNTESEASSNRNRDSIEKIRAYSISALRDYHDTVSKIVDIINSNRDLWKNPYINGDRKGFVHGNPYTLGDNDFWHSECPFEFRTGYFTLTSKNMRVSIKVRVDGIYGTKQRTGYCGNFEDHDLDTKNWKAMAVDLDLEEDPWEHDLTKSTFTVTGSFKKEDLKPYTEENIGNYNWKIEGWINIKEKADRTRKRTEKIISIFKEVLKERIDEADKKIKQISSSGNDVYVKVGL